MVLSVGWRAGADGAHLPARDTEAAARAFDIGKGLYADHKLEEARAAFAEAVENDPNVVQYLANLGTVELGLGRNRDAAEHLTRAIELIDDDPSVDPQKAEPLRRLRDAAGREVGALEVRVNVTGARIYIDERHIGSAPVGTGAAYLDPGEHRIRATADGYGDVTVGMTLEKGERKAVSLTLPASSMPAPAARHGTGGPEVPRAGDGGGTAQHVTIIAGASLTVVALTTGIAASVASGRAGAEVTELAGVLDIEFPAHNGCVAPTGSRVLLCAALNSSAEAERVWRTTAIAGYSVAGALGLGTVLAGALWPGADEGGAARALAVPWASHGVAGIAVVGAF
ncbi:MAG: PEGA domain-containing protein [Myxococcales bacterium]|nr:PEGA domain-containing protein [Myxococcales bacterium]